MSAQSHQHHPGELSTPEARWRFAAAQRPWLSAAARGATANPADADDGVAVAIERAADAPITDPAALCAWLKTTTIRAAREPSRTADRSRYHPSIAPDPPADPAETVADRAEAAWVARLVERLPDRHQRALRIVADGGSVAEVATRLGLSLRTASRTLDQSRRHLRALIAAASLGALTAYLRHPQRRRTVAASTVPAALCLARAVVVLGPFDTPRERDVEQAAGPAVAAGGASSRGRWMVREPFARPPAAPPRGVARPPGRPAYTDMVSRQLPGLANLDGLRRPGPVPVAASYQRGEPDGRTLFDDVLHCVERLRIDPGSGVHCRD